MSNVLNPEDALKLKFVRDGQVSPDGKSVAYTVSLTEQGKQVDSWELHIRDLLSGAEKIVADGSVVASPRWASDSARLVYVKRGPERDSVVILDTRNGGAREILMPTAGINSVPMWSPDNTKIALVLGTHRDKPAVRRITARLFRAENVGYVEQISQRLCTLDLASGAITTLVEEAGMYSNLEWEESGRQILFMRLDAPKPFGWRMYAHLFVVDVADRQVRPIAGDGWTINAAYWVPDGRRIVIVGSYQSKTTVPTTDLWVLNRDGTNIVCRSTPVQGRIGLRMHHDMPSYGMGVPALVKNHDAVWAVVQHGGRVEIYEISLSGKDRCERLVGGDRSCVILSASAAASKGSEGARKLLIAAMDMITPFDLYVLQATTETRVTRLNERAMAEWPATRRQTLQIRSADGLEFDGWFMAGANQTGPLPTVMYVHGGPFLALGHAFRFDFLMLVSRGYGIVFSNFRGSYGYGDDFARAVMGDWARKGFPDHMATADHVIEQGLADPKRMGVWGHSHGGFATCWIVTHTNRFRAAISEAPVTDFTFLYYTTDLPDGFAFDLGGSPRQVPDIYRTHSPITYVDQCKTPILMMHPEGDLRTTLPQSEMFYRALQDAGCESELVILGGVDHMGYAIGPPPVRAGQKAAVLDWFERHLGRLG